MNTTNVIRFAEFDKIYQRNVDAVLEHWTVEMQRQIAVHCYGWSPGQFDFTRYLRNSTIRFYRALQAFSGYGDRVADIGGFWGVFPMTLQDIGYMATMTESLKYYGASFDPIFDLVRRRGVEIYDYDPFDDGPPLEKQFDIITVMAVIEHYPHSLRKFMDNILRSITDNGKIFLEVPNVAYLPRRLKLMYGVTPYTPVQQIYMSAVPFIGHHHEFTMTELHTLADLSGLSVIREDYYNYFRGTYSDSARYFRHPLEWLVFKLWKRSRECISVLCEPRKGAAGLAGS